MELLKDKEFKGLFFEIISEGVDWGETFCVNLRITNLNDTKKKLAINARYISINYGLLDMRGMIPSLFQYGKFLHSDSFVDTEMCFDTIKQSYDGDRIELDVNEGRIASLLLKKEKSQWWIVENKTKSFTNKELKNKIEHFEYLDEKFGLTLQKFSARVIDDNSIELFCEVISANAEVGEKGFNVEVAIYDTDDNIVKTDRVSKYGYDFQGFEVFHFGPIKLDIFVEEIGKIRFYPTR